MDDICCFGDDEKGLMDDTRIRFCAVPVRLDSRVVPIDCACAEAFENFCVNTLFALLIEFAN